jgi:uncharacterized membrane protein
LSQEIRWRFAVYETGGTPIATTVPVQSHFMEGFPMKTSDYVGTAGSWTGFLAGAGVGAACMYLIDPNRGASRRGLIRGKLTRAAHKTGDGLDAASRDLAHRAQGVWASSQHWLSSEDAPDEVLVERVRARLGRYVSHPHAIDVSAEDGRVTLRGKILKREVRPLIRAVGTVAGVHEIDNLLEEHERPGNVPSLQGGTRRRGELPDIMQTNWSPTARTMVGSIGSALTAYGASRRDAIGGLVGLAGAALVVRAATNLDAARLVGAGGGRRAIDIQKTIHINVPVSTVFDFWSSFENFPRFMKNVREVRATKDDGQSHWTVAGPGQVPIEFDAVITDLVPNEVLAWKTVEGAPVAHAGIVRFEPDEFGGTRLHIRFSYNPPGGAIGHAFAVLLGDDPKTKMDQDLARMKTLIETGNPPRDAAKPLERAPEALM